MAAPYLYCPNGAVETVVVLVRPMVLVLVAVATMVAFVAGLFAADETVAVAVKLPTGYPAVESMGVAVELDFHRGTRLPAAVLLDFVSADLDFLADTVADVVAAVVDVASVAVAKF